MLSDYTAGTPEIKFLPFATVRSLCMHAVHAAAGDMQCTAGHRTALALISNTSRNTAWDTKQRE